MGAMFLSVIKLIFGTFFLFLFIFYRISDDCLWVWTQESASSSAASSFLVLVSLTGVSFLSLLRSQVWQGMFCPGLVFFSFFFLVGWKRSSEKVLGASWCNILLLSFQAISIQYVHFFPSLLSWRCFESLSALEQQIACSCVCVFKCVHVTKRELVKKGCSMDSEHIF